VVVTVVELLSPSNKYASSDREQYVGKRAQLLTSHVNLVEIDLLRGGPRMPMEDLPACDYCVMVCRAADWPEAGVWPNRLREPLSPIPVPLREPDLDATLDVQAILHRVYDAARYQSYIYEGKPEPSLSPEDAAWAEQFVPAR
jgi:hypothetical protein